ncbi:MAG: AraC family transcriptional regulator [Marinobacter sp.]|nr:AraC family transcriptional regulator [Marinobacter sp.]
MAKITVQGFASWVRPVRHRAVIAMLVAALCPMAGQALAAEGTSKSVPAAALDQIIETPMSIRKSRQQAQQAVNDLSRDIQGLKQSVVALNKDLRVLEEDLLFPANTQFSVFLSLDVGEFFRLEGVKLKVDSETVTSYLYSDQEREALAKGGMHRLHLGNISPGEHTVSAFFVGAGPNGREYKRGTTQTVTKGGGPKYVELSIVDSEARQQPEFSIREW